MRLAQMGCYQSKGRKKSQFQQKYPKAASAITVFQYQEGKLEEVFELVKSQTRNTTGLLSLTALEIGESKVQSVAVYESKSALAKNALLLKDLVDTQEESSEPFLAGPPVRITGEVYSAGGMTDFASAAESGTKAAAAKTTLKVTPEGVALTLELCNEMPDQMMRWPGYMGMTAIQLDDTTFQICVVYASMEKLKENTDRALEFMRTLKEYIPPESPPERVVGVVGYAFIKRF